jgi:predicted nucleic acid-binding protein
MTWDMHPQHVSASRWYAGLNGSADSSLLLCRATMLGLWRLLTNRTVIGDSTVTLSDALDLYDQWIRDPRVELAPEPRRIDKLFRQALSPVSRQPATKALGTAI